MAVRFTNVRLSGGDKHEHITHLRGVDDTNSKIHEDTRAGWVSWVEGGGSAYVLDSRGSRAPVVVVKPPLGSKYLRTVANGVYTDNLLALPRF